MSAVTGPPPGPVTVIVNCAGVEEAVPVESKTVSVAVELPQQCVIFFFFCTSTLAQLRVHCMRDSLHDMVEDMQLRNCLRAAGVCTIGYYSFIMACARMLTKAEQFEVTPGTEYRGSGGFPRHLSVMVSSN